MKRRNIVNQPCFSCKVVKPLTSTFFYKDRSRVSGLCNRCRECYKKITPSLKYKQYRNNAKSRGLTFNITKEEFSTFWQKECYYCGERNLTLGIDRINNLLGYSMENLVPCCKECNVFKRSQTREEFLVRIGRIAKLHNL